jgi:hypothetical protein
MREKVGFVIVSSHSYTCRYCLSATNVSRHVLVCSSGYLFSYEHLRAARSDWVAEEKLAHSEEEPSLEEGRCRAFKLRTSPGTKIRGTVSRFVLFYII